MFQNAVNFLFQLDGIGADMVPDIARQTMDASDVRQEADRIFLRKNPISSYIANHLDGGHIEMVSDENGIWFGLSNEPDPQEDGS